MKFSLLHTHIYIFKLNITEKIKWNIILLFSIKSPVLYNKINRSAWELCLWKILVFIWMCLCVFAYTQRERLKWFRNNRCEALRGQGSCINYNSRKVVVLVYSSKKNRAVTVACKSSRHNKSGCLKENGKQMTILATNSVEFYISGI